MDSYTPIARIDGEKVHPRERCARLVHYREFSLPVTYWMPMFAEDTPMVPRALFIVRVLEEKTNKKDLSVTFDLDVNQMVEEESGIRARFIVSFVD